MATSTRRGVGGMARQANPAFAAGVVAVPFAALAYAATLGSFELLTYVHVMAGAMWTGGDLFMGFVLGPVLGGLDHEKRAAVFRRLTPKAAFLFPALALVTITAGTTMADRLGILGFSHPWVAAALGIVTLLSVIGFGVILPNEVRIYRELVSEAPDVERISRLGMLNAKLGGVQGVLQLAIIFVMVQLRF